MGLSQSPPHKSTHHFTQSVDIDPITSKLFADLEMFLEHVKHQASIYQETATQSQNVLLKTQQSTP